MYSVPCSLQSAVGWLFFIDILRVVSHFNGGLQLLCFCRRSQASCASCGLVSPKGVWCIWLSYSGGLSCGCPLFGSLLHAQISSYLHWALAFPVNWLIHWVFAYVSLWIGTLLRVPDSLCYEWFSSTPGALVYFSKSPTIDLRCSHLDLYQISSNINKFLNHIIKHDTVLGTEIILFIWSIFVSESCSASG